jgi:hypothetical protein
MAMERVVNALLGDDAVKAPHAAHH